MISIWSAPEGVTIISLCGPGTEDEGEGEVVEEGGEEGGAGGEVEEDGEHGNQTLSEYIQASNFIIT